MRSRVAFILLALTASLFAVPVVAHAVSIPFFGPIIGDTFDGSCPLGWGALMLVINNIIRFLLTIIIVFVAPLMVAYAGFLLVVNAVNPAGKEQAKKMLLNLVVGFAVALSAWLIVDALMAVLYNPQAKGFGANWYDIVTTGGEPACLIPKAVQTPSAVKTPQVAVVPLSTQTAVQLKASKEQVVRSELNAAGVFINHKNWCPVDTPYQSVPGGCTDVGGLLPATISYVKKIRSACGSGCPAFTITGGSELGHAVGDNSHEKGYKIDLGGTTITQLDTFVCAGKAGCISESGLPYNGGHLKYSGKRTGDEPGLIYKDNCENTWVRESSHWDITVLRDCANIRAK